MKMPREDQPKNWPMRMVLEVGPGPTEMGSRHELTRLDGTHRHRSSAVFCSVHRQLEGDSP